MAELCVNCRFFLPNPDNPEGAGACMRYPPLQTEPRRPLPLPTEWCGEYQAEGS